VHGAPRSEFPKAHQWTTASVPMAGTKRTIEGNGQLRARLEHMNREFADASMRLVVERLPRPFDAAAMLDNPDADDLFVCFHGPPIMGVGTR